MFDCDGKLWLCILCGERVGEYTYSQTDYREHDFNRRDYNLFAHRADMTTSWYCLCNDRRNFAPSLRLPA